MSNKKIYVNYLYPQKAKEGPKVRTCRTEGCTFLVKGYRRMCPEHADEKIRQSHLNYSRKRRYTAQ